MTKPWHLGTHLRVLSKSYTLSTDMTGFKWFSKIFASLCFGKMLSHQGLINKKGLIQTVHRFKGISELQKVQIISRTTFSPVVQMCTVHLSVYIDRQMYIGEERQPRIWFLNASTTANLPQTSSDFKCMIMFYIVMVKIR